MSRQGSGQDKSIRIRKTALAAGLCLALLGSFFFFVGIQYEADYVALSERGQTVLARVTDVQETEDGGETSYRIHYEFDVDGETYTRTDITAQPDQWVDVSEPVWNEANSTGTLPVHYLPEDPTINWPEQAKGSPLTIGYVTEGLGAGMLALFLGLIARAAAEFRRLRSSEDATSDDCIMVELAED